jgi:tetratricopeptide (TPR) repeat protein
MTEAVYEQYKEALRRGHIAALRGRHEVAVAAYSAAVQLAPERPLPHTSLGSAFLRLDRPADALASFDAALSCAPDDEAALNGRSNALVALGRPADAAASLDRLADALDRSGRIADACDAARAALELAESRSRRRHVRDLAARLRADEPDDTGREALARALQVLELGTGPLAVATAPAESPETAAGAPDGAAQAAAREGEDPLALVLEAEAAEDRGDTETARARFADALVAHRRRDEPNAALDAAARALRLDPLATDLHLALADLYLDRGWRSLAASKLVLIARLAAISADEETRAKVREVASGRLPEHEVLAALLA